jgi:hypothetical protein
MFKVAASTENNKGINEACIECFGENLEKTYGTTDVNRLIREGWIEIKDGIINFYFDEME